MKVFLIILCVVSFTVTVFLVGRYGIKRKDSQDYVSADKTCNDK